LHHVKVHYSFPPEREATNGVGSVICDDRVRLVYEVDGEGPAIVFVAGLGDDRRSWANQVAHFSSDHTVITIDNRGCGESDVPLGPYSIGRLAADAHSVVARLGLAGITAVGSSMGGAICQRWALDYPADLAQLVITNSWGERDTFIDALFEHWISLAGQGSAAYILQSLLLFCYSPEYLTRHPETVAAFLASPPPNLSGFVAAAQACRNHDTAAVACEIHQPTLVIAGTFDILTRPVLSERLAGRLPQATLRNLPTGHMVFWEMPDEFNALLREFMA
jgi:3-oxoadipate enol-lactonase